MTFGISAAAWAGIAMAGATVYSANKSAGAAKDAAKAQTQTAQQGVDQSNLRFEAVQKLLAPYVNAGTPAMAAQQDLLGLNGMPAQQGAINGIQNSPMFGAMAQQGEDAILQNASATGGLRGGNVQGALAQFRPALLNSLIDQQYQRLGGMTSIGQNAAAGVGNAGMNTGSQIVGLLGQQGAAQAGGLLAEGRAAGQMVNGVAGAFGLYRGLGGTAFAPTPPPNVGWTPGNSLF